MIPWPIIVAKASYFIGYIASVVARMRKPAKGLWKSGKLIRKAVSNQAIHDVAAKTTRVLLNSKATWTFVRKTKLDFFQRDGLP